MNFSPPYTWLLLAIVALPAASLSAQPRLNAAQQAGPLTVYPDVEVEQTRLYYYVPGKFRLAQEPGGAPAFRLLRMRYMGTLAMGNIGETDDLSLLHFKVMLERPGREAFAEAKRALRRVNPLSPKPKLRPLPLAHVTMTAVYALPGRDSVAALGVGHHHGSGSNRYGSLPEALSFTFRLDPTASSLFWHTLHAGETLLSISYALVAEGATSAHELHPTLTTSGNAAGSAVLDSLLQASLAALIRPDTSAKMAPAEALVAADAFSVNVNLARHPDLVAEVDLNAEVPPGFPLLEVFCYDFAEGLRPDLAAKNVEIEASSPGGGTTKAVARFRRTRTGVPAPYYQPIEFEFSARLDRPYRYRVVEIAADGTRTVGAWTERESWANALEVTSPPADLHGADVTEQPGAPLNTPDENHE